MSLMVGDKVRYSVSFLAAHENAQVSAYLATLEGTILELHNEGETAQINFGSVMRASSMVRVALLEKAPESAMRKGCA
jgi:hypothetical protein